jgi:ABC-type Fe3+ transport system substrate-binding protein
MFPRLLILAALAGIVALPFALRPATSAAAATDDTLVIITPHNEALRTEFGRGFQKWYQARTGRTVAVDWRVIGGTSEIARYLEGEYVASYQNRWTGELKRAWSTEIQAGFQSNPAADAPAAVKEARADFLASNVSSGLDLFFGGGVYDFDRQARAGRIVDSGIMKQHPDWFGEAAIPQAVGGQTFWDKDGRWIGSVLSSYGIIFNRDSWRRLGIEREPRQWSDLKDPRLVGEIALCDPTRSGSIAAAFENLIQQQMHLRVTALQAADPARAARDPKGLESEAVREGWIEGLRLLQLIGANARYFTDTSQKPPIDVAAGNCAAGMCIDFYGRQQAEAVSRRDGPDRLGYVSPPGGTSYSVDPIALMRGAPHAAVAKLFIEYVLSPEGQAVWNLRPGTPGGPERFALRRLPVRKDFYKRTDLQPLRSDPQEDPFAAGGQLVYRSEWTGAIFNEMSFIIRVMAHDTHTELTRAWRAIIAAPEPRKSQALAALQDMSAVDYAQAGTTIKQGLGAKDKSIGIRLAAELGESFRRNYARAEAIAEGRE